MDYRIELEKCEKRNDKLNQLAFIALCGFIGSVVILCAFSGVVCVLGTITGVIVGTSLLWIFDKSLNLLDR